NEESGVRWVLGAGIALGLLQALRGNAVVVALPCAWSIARGRATRPALVRIATLLAGMVLVLSPLVVRDRVAAARGRGTSLWGIHFYVATQSGADGTYIPVPGVRDDVVGHVVDARTLAEQAEGHSLTPFEVSWHWFRRGLAAIRAHPRAYADLQFRK